MSKTCKKCGSLMDDNARFCPQCGNPVEQVNESVSEETPPLPNNGQGNNASPAGKSDKTLVFVLVGVFFVIAVLFGVVIAASNHGYTSGDDYYSCDSDTVVADSTTVDTTSTEPTTEEEDVPDDFITGGNTYVGVRDHEVETQFDDEDHKRGDMVRYVTHYTIKCYKDGTMTWSEKTTKDGKECSPRKFEGEWKKVTISKHDEVYSWYEFWATTYDMHLNSSYSRIGVIDEKGQLYFEGADPRDEIPENSTQFVLCTVSRQ